jgi:hypothetical protein
MSPKLLISCEIASPITFTTHMIRITIKPTKIFYKKKSLNDKIFVSVITY